MALNDGFAIGPVAGTNTFGPFNVVGGVYALCVVGATAAQLFTKGPDNSTDVAVGAAVTGPIYQSPIYLDPGTVTITVTTGATVYASLSRIKIG